MLERKDESFSALVTFIREVTECGRDVRSLDIGTYLPCY